MLQWEANDGTYWYHRAYWGEDMITDWGVRTYMGPLPTTGGWVPLAVPAESVALAGKTVYGMAFTLYDGMASWDAAGVCPAVADSDNDGLPDAWELSYFGNLNQGYYDDYDGDGALNPTSRIRPSGKCFSQCKCLKSCGRASCLKARFTGRAQFDATTTSRRDITQTAVGASLRNRRRAPVRPLQGRTLSRFRNRSFHLRLLMPGRFGTALMGWYQEASSPVVQTHPLFGVLEERIIALPHVFARSTRKNNGQEHCYGSIVETNVAPAASSPGALSLIWAKSMTRTNPPGQNPSRSSRTASRCRAPSRALSRRTPDRGPSRRAPRARPALRTATAPPAPVGRLLAGGPTPPGAGPGSLPGRTAAVPWHRPARGFHPAHSLR